MQHVLPGYSWLCGIHHDFLVHSKILPGSQVHTSWLAGKFGVKFSMILQYIVLMGVQYLQDNHITG